MKSPHFLFFFLYENSPPPFPENELKLTLENITFSAGGVNRASLTLAHGAKYEVPQT